MPWHRVQVASDGHAGRRASGDFGMSMVAPQADGPAAPQSTKFLDVILGGGQGTGLDAIDRSKPRPARKKHWEVAAALAIASAAMQVTSRMNRAMRGSSRCRKPAA